MLDDTFVIKVRLESLGKQLQGMIAVHSAEIQQQVQNSVDNFCEPENLKRVIQSEVSERIKEKLSESIKDYFGYGDGSRFIKKQLAEIFNKYLDTEE